MRRPSQRLTTDLVLPFDASSALDRAAQHAPVPRCTPRGDVEELRARLESGERAAAALLRSQATAPMPGDAALLGALVRLTVQRADVTVDGNLDVPLDQTVSPARGQAVVPGSLRVHGDLEVVAPLVVCGDLVVDGAIIDCGPQSVLVVLGTLRCRCLRTSGEVLITNDLEATTFVWGHYNDNVLEVHGTLRTPVLMSDDHAIEAGAIEVVHRPPPDGTWGDDTFDMTTGHVQALAQLATDPAAFPAGDIDLDHLATLLAPWSAPR